MDTTEIEKGPKQGVYANSPFQDIGSILSVIGAYGGRAPGDADPLTLAGYGAKDIFKFLKDLELPSFGGGSATGTGDADTQGGYDFYGNRIG
jgi:hypothetical protein